MKPQVQFRLRIHRGEVIAIGPGKVSLLEAIDRTGSISAAGRELGMSYRRAWLLIDEINQSLKEPAVTTSAGGAHGGGTALTPVGQALIQHYRAAEATALKAATKELERLTRLLAP
ncbi:MAG: LysR family transcriptional regulator [Burkholderiaceae bacterium]|jgi:molybdate transport system regulatory protein|nr:LysR family transcriptional regulator [Burkholderiaceae bacterium]MDO9090656.1 LysR family transcriptional regulator [Burkholderiaceae bacterium]MDP1969212.1 LysR family transcriptional regulator [Burkholderiaceae bacterium]MDP3134761.1 LysR family transcriptional regulator [Burkholderiaceae bacterium]